MKLPASLRESLERWAKRYQTNLYVAERYLIGRGIPAAVAEAARLGVVTEPEAGHEQYAGRLSIPFLTKAGVNGMKFRCMAHDDCKAVDCVKYLQIQGLPHRMYNVNAFFTEGAELIVVTEGELDALTLHGLVNVPAVGVPGANSWREFWPRCFEDWTVIVVGDGDDAGRKFANGVARTLDGPRVVIMPEGEDVNSVYVREGADKLKKLLGIKDEAGSQEAVG